MTQQPQGAGAAELDPKASGPANAFLKEQQTMTGANATGGEGSGTAAGQSGPAASGSGGGTASASPAASSEVQTLQTISETLIKMNQRFENQGKFMQALDGGLKQTRKDFETRFTAFEERPPAAAGAATGEGENTPPPLDAKKLSNQVIAEVLPAVKEYLGEFLGPVVAQTRTNTAAQIVANAQHNPQVKEMVDALPPQVRATLSQDVHRRLGDAMFAEPDLLYDGPDPVAEAIEMIHYRTVVKAGYKPQTEAGEQTHQTGGAETHPGLSPVPATGTRSETQTADPDKDLTEKIYAIKIDGNSPKYPGGIEEELRSAGV